MRITDIYQQGSTLHIKASKIWQQRLHNYSVYDSIDIPIIEADASKFAGKDAELIALMKVLNQNREQPRITSLMDDNYLIEYENGDKAAVNHDALLKQIQRCKSTAEALEILKSLV